MILIADSSALVALSVVNQLDVLEKIFGEVYVPRAVYEEVRQENKEESKRLERYCKDIVVDISTPFNFNVTLGKGESEAIVLYEEKRADFLLCDDKKAKRFAQSFGVNVIGSLGILLKAKKEKYIEEISPLIALLQDSRVYIDDKTYNLVLKMAGEL